MALSAVKTAALLAAGVLGGDNGGGGNPALPVAANNRVAWFGDSRTQAISATVPDANILLASGQGIWALQGTNYRWRTPRGNNFGIGGDTTTMMVARLSAVVASNCGTVVFLGGVNDGLSIPYETTVANYTTIFNALRDAGKVVIVCNELPNSAINNTPVNAPAASAAQLARRDWLEHPARKVTWPNLVVVDTYRACLKAGTTYEFKDGFAPDGLHPAMRGNRTIGAVVASALNALRSGDTSYRNLPTSSADVYDAATNPFGCILPDFMLTGTTGTATGVTGQVATGWAFSVGNAGEVTIQVSKGVDSDGFDQQIIRVFGTPTGTARGVTFQKFVNDTPNLGKVAAGDQLAVMGRVIVDAGYTGQLRGIGINCSVNGNNGSSQNLAVQGYGGSGSAGNDWDMEGAVFDQQIASQIAPVHADWATMTSRGLTASLSLTYGGNNVPIDFTVRVSRLAMRKVAA